MNSLVFYLFFLTRFQTSLTASSESGFNWKKSDFSGQWHAAVGTFTNCCAGPLSKWVIVWFSLVS